MELPGRAGSQFEVADHECFMNLVQGRHCAVARSSMLGFYHMASGKDGKAMGVLRLRGAVEMMDHGIKLGSLQSEGHVPTESKVPD